MRVVAVGMTYAVVTVPIDDFPVTFRAQRDVRISASVGGSGFTTACALAALGDEVYLASPLGEDADAAAVDAAAYHYGLNSAMCPRSLPRSPRAVVLEDRHGRWQIHRDLGEASSTPVELDLGAMTTADLVVLDGALPATALLSGARAAGVPVAVDIGSVGGPPGAEQQQYLAADLIVMSHAGAPGTEEQVLRAWRESTAARLVVVTLGERGAIGLGRDSDEVRQVPAQDLGPGRRPAGLGATHFAALAHYTFARGYGPATALAYAATAAAWTIAHPDAPDGLCEQAVETAAQEAVETAAVQGDRAA